MSMRKLLSIIVFIFLKGILIAAPFQENGSYIKGKVTDLNGKPLPGASVSIEKSRRGVITASGGDYTISGLTDGAYVLRVSFLGYETLLKDVKLKGETILNITLTEKPYITEDVLVNATRAGEHSPLAYTTVDNLSLRKQNTGQDLPYLLSLTPSLVETSEAGNGVGYTNLRIRGTDANRINVTIDGIPLNDPESQQVFWVDLPDIASSIENIQIQRGAGTSVNGAGAFGATLSLQTTNPGNEPFAEVNSSMGSFNTFKNSVSAATGLLGGKFALQMRYSDLKSDGYINRTGSDHRSALISGIFRSEKSSLKANIILGEEHTGIGWWGVPKDSLATNRRYNPSGEYTDESGVVRYYNNESDNYIQDHFQLIYSLKISSFLFLNAALHYTHGKGYYEEYNQDQALVSYGIPSFNIGDSTITQSDLITQKWLSNNFYGLVYSVKYQKERLEVIAGGGMNLYLGDHFGNIIWMRNGGNTGKDYRWYSGNARKGEISLYGKVNYSLSDKITMFGDLQYRYILYKMKGIEDNLMDISQEHRYGFINPKAGIFYAITSQQDAYLSFSVANREPTRSDFTEASGDQDATPKDETLYDTEIGYKLRTGKNSLSVNLFGMTYKDQLVPTGQLSNVGYSIMTNVSRSYRLGIEMSAAIKLSDRMNWSSNLTLSRNKIRDFVDHYVDYSSSDWSSRNLSKSLGEVDIAYSPPVTATSDIAFNIMKGIELHLTSKYVGKQYFDNTMNPERSINPYFVNNFRIDFEPKLRNIKGTEIQLLINNVFNKLYENNAYGGNWYEDGIEKSWSYYFPQAGINYMLKIGIKF
jgi:iron complex outermembrane recepter protein